ncbi:MAG: outer membrane lipoprotein-sorting protein [Desulfomonilaceae bacterium]
MTRPISSTERQGMRHTTNRYLFALIGLVLLCIPFNVQAMTAHEILEQVFKQNLSDTFRAALTVKTFKGKKVLSDHVLWLVGKTNQDTSTFFVDFVEPKESKGLRFLFEVEPGKDPKAFMYMPAAGKTLPLAVDDPSVDIGATGLTMEDIQGFVPKGGEKETVLKEEKVDGRDCYVIKISLPDGKGERLIWVSKNDFLIVKSQHLDAQGKIKRTFRVVEFFKTEKGKEFPREEEITIPDKGTRIQLRQDNAVFGIALPDEVTDPAKFGTFAWKD